MVIDPEDVDIVVVDVVVDVLGVVVVELVVEDAPPAPEEVVSSTEQP